MVRILARENAAIYAFARHDAAELASLVLA